MRSTQLRLSIVSACCLHQRELNVFFPHHLTSCQYATSLSPARASRSHNVIALSASSSQVSHSYHSASAFHPTRSCGVLCPNKLVSHPFVLPLFSLMPHSFFLSVSSFLIYYFSLLFWLLLIHLLRTGKYWATHLNNTYVKWDVLVPELPVKAVVCHISYHDRTNLVWWEVSIQLLLL